MKYAALLRGINVGKSRRIDMKSLKELFELLGYSDVSTYINSGNVIFSSPKSAGTLRGEIESGLKETFGQYIPALVISIEKLKKIVEAIPAEWENDDEQRTDVAFLFDKADSADIIDRLPIKMEFADVRYVKGALYWNVKRENYNRSRLNKLISHDLYQFMTLRNVNTARHLAGK